MARPSQQYPVARKEWKLEVQDSFQISSTAASWDKYASEPEFDFAEPSQAPFGESRSSRLQHKPVLLKGSNDSINVSCVRKGSPSALLHHGF